MTSPTDETRPPIRVDDPTCPTYSEEWQMELDDLAAQYVKEVDRG